MSLDSAALLAEVVASLDGPLARASTAERLEDLVARLVTPLNAAAASISICRSGGDTIDDAFMLDARRGRVWRRELGETERVWPLEDYPLSAAVLDHGGTFVVRADDPSADAAERAYLAQFGLVAVLAAAARDDEGGWLMEVYADASTVPLEPLEPVARLLVAEAVRGRSFQAPAQAA
jgi:hypothetical protein